MCGQGSGKGCFSKKTAPEISNYFLCAIRFSDYCPNTPQEASPPASVLEMAFFALGLLSALNRKPMALLPLAAVGTLTRETMRFIPFLCFL
jgi:hypothetical protein